MHAASDLCSETPEVEYRNPFRKGQQCFHLRSMSVLAWEKLITLQQAKPF